jgi:hypothetical protein
LNYTGKFDAVLPIVGSGPHSHAHGHFETISRSAAHAPSDAIIVPDAQLLFNGDFKPIFYSCGGRTVQKPA